MSARDEAPVAKLIYEASLIAWRELRDLFMAHRRNLTRDNVPALVIAVRAAFLANKKMKVKALATKKCLEGVKANYFHALLLRRSRALDRGEDNVKNNYRKLSSDQINLVHKQVIAEFVNLEESVQLQDINIPDFIGFLIAAALYDKKHNNPPAIENFNKMIIVEDEKPNTFVIDFSSAELNKRIQDFMSYSAESAPDTPGSAGTLSVGSQDDSVDFEGPSESLTDKEMTNMATRISQTARWTRNELWKLLEKRSLNREDEELVKSKIDQLNNIELAIRPIRIAVVGCVSAGKSTFLSALLGQENFLASGNGAVTNVLAEIEFADEEHYVATLFFSTAEDIKRYYTVVKASSDDAEPIDSEEVAARSAVEILFDNFDEHMKSGCPLHPSEAARYLGHAPVKLHSNSLQEISKLLRESLRDNEQQYSCTLQSIRITGPFEHIPAGVVLVDTPGLDDANQINSHRTLNELHRFDEVWYAAPYDTAMGRETDQLVIRKLLSLPRNQAIRLHVVATKADHENDRDENTRLTFEDNIFLALCRHELENRGVDPKMLASTALVKSRFRNLLPDIQNRVKQLSKRVTINFVATRHMPTIGLDYWRNRLQLISNDMKEKVMLQNTMLHSIKNPPSTSERVRGAGGARRIPIMWRNAEAVFHGIIDKIDMNIISVKLTTDCWKAINAATVKALMPRHRGGKFKGRSSKNYQYDINFNIAEHWLFYGGLRQGWETFLNSMEEIRVAATNCAPDSVQCNSFYDEVQSLGRLIFEMDVKDKIQSMMLSDNIYCRGRATLPTKEELRSILKRLIDHARTALMLIKKLFRGITHGLLSYQGSLNTVVNRVLYNQVCGGSEAIPPIQFVSAISDTLMTMPVMTECCDRAINQDEFDEKHSCPLCGSPRWGVYEDPVLRRQMNLWIQENRFEPPTNEWWTVLNMDTATIPQPTESISRKRKSTVLDETPHLGHKQHRLITLFISKSEIAFGEQLGSGGFGTVHKGTYQFEDVAIKCPQGNLEQSTIDEMLKEAKIIQDFDHPNVVKFYGVLVDNDVNQTPRGLVMELGSKGNLYHYLEHNFNTMDWLLKLKLARGLACGLTYLHDVENIIHQDIKSLNVVLNGDLVPKWCDFGMAKLRDHTTKVSTEDATQQIFGTVRWSAPERLLPTAKPSRPADVWAMGMVFYEIVSGKVPFHQCRDFPTIVAAIASRRVDSLPQECESRYPPLANTIRACWRMEPNDRPSASTVLDVLNKLLCDSMAHDGRNLNIL